MNIDDLRFVGGIFPLVDYTLIEFKGKDVERFLQGQTTADISLLENKYAVMNSRSMKNGKFFSYFYTAKLDDTYYFLIENKLTEKTLLDLEKYLIMDDVVYRKIEESLTLIVGPKAILEEERKIQDKGFYLSFNGEYSLMTWMEVNSSFPLISEELMEELRILSGWPKWDIDITSKNFITDSYLNEIAISYKKGCFLGQETIAKIQNNRGSSYYHVLLEVLSDSDVPFQAGVDFSVDKRKGGTIFGIARYKDKTFLKASLYRDFRVSGKRIKIELNDREIETKVLYFPMFNGETREKKASELYYEGVSLFQKDQEEVAKNYLECSLQLNPLSAETYESLGVIYGRHGEYETAISLMDKLLKIKPESVMAHTNKSLYLMKMGKIEEAEEEKSLATVKSFAQYGEEAKSKKILEEEEKKKAIEMEKREKMFFQVLDIDSEDLVANFGLGDISFARKNFELAVKYLTKVLFVDPKYSRAYLILGKCYEELGQVDTAKSTYEKGVSIASQKGDFAPANEMQTRLAKLSNSI